MSQFTGGIPINFSKLKQNDNGSYEGYPPELEWIFTRKFDTAPTLGDTTDMERYMVTHRF